MEFYSYLECHVNRVGAGQCSEQAENRGGGVAVGEHEKSTGVALCSDYCVLVLYLMCTTSTSNLEYEICHMHMIAMY